MQTLTEELDRAGYQVILGQAGYDHAREAALLDTFVGRWVDGIVVCGLLRSTAAARRLGKLAIPVVEIWDLSDRPLDMLVGFSHVKVGSAVAGFFLDKGWRRAAMASGDDERAAARREGFLGELLQRHDDLRAVYCSSDGLAQGVLAEAQARGLRVPDDLAVVGFGGADFAAHLVPSLTTVHVDGAAIGRRAAQLIIERCQGETVNEPILDVGFRIVQRQSTAT